MSHLECFCTSLANRASDPHSLESEGAHRISQASPTTRSQIGGTNADQLHIDKEDNPLMGKMTRHNNEAIKNKYEYYHDLSCTIYIYIV